MSPCTKGYYCLEKGSAGREKYKILLVYPKVGSEAKNVSLFPPLALLYLASHLKEFSVAIFDQRVDDIKRFDELLAQRPLCVGFSVMTGPQIKFSLELADNVKEKGIPTVFGGVHPSILPEQTKEDMRVDYIIVGEGELGFRNLIESLADNKKIGPIIKEGKAVDLNNAPVIPYELVDVEEYVYSGAIQGRALPVVFSRGCPFACTFCCNPILTNRKWRTMDVGLITRQLHELGDTYNLESVIFWDENMTVDPHMVNELAKGMGGRFKWLAQSRMNMLLKLDLGYLETMGLVLLSCGIESGSTRILDKIKKEEKVEEYREANRLLAKTAISAWYNYIVGYPFETVEDLKLTVELAMQMLDENPHANNNTFYILVPYPGSEIASFINDSNMLPRSFREWADFGRYNFNVNWHTPDMLKLYERVCFSSKFVGRKLLRLFPQDQGLKDLSRVFSDKWRQFDFCDNKEWEYLQRSGQEVLRKLFGDNAY